MLSYLVDEHCDSFDGGLPPINQSVETLDMSFEYPIQISPQIIGHDSGDNSGSDITQYDLSGFPDAKF